MLASAIICCVKKDEDPSALLLKYQGSLTFALFIIRCVKASGARFGTVVKVSDCY